MDSVSDRHHSGQSGEVVDRKIAIIGATSVSHGRRLINDLFTFPWAGEVTLSLMALHMRHLAGAVEYARRIAGYHNVQTVVAATTCLETAIEGAAIVFLLYDAGGFSAFDTDFRIAGRFGIDLCIGDTLGPTGIMKAIRNVAVLERIAQVVHRCAPEALVISYVNPMAPMTMCAARLGLRNFVGICGGVEATRKTIAACLEQPLELLTTRFAGINHMAWATEIRNDHTDLYPLLRRRMTLPQWIQAEPIRAELLQHFGYFATETSGHLSDVFPWFRRDTAARRRYCSGRGYSGASGAYHRIAGYVHRRLGDLNPFEYETGELDPRSADYGVMIAAAWLSGTRYECYGNLPNATGLVPNLPADAAVEVPLRIEGQHLHGESVAPLPSQLAGLCNTNVIVQRICAEAALGREPELLLAAISIDPLTAATIDLRSSRRLTEQLVAANRSSFPGLKFPFRFDDVPIDSAGTVPGAQPQGEDVLAPVRRFDRLRKQRRARL